MKRKQLTLAQFDSMVPQLTALVRDWADRECTSFDEAVRRASGDQGAGIWEMPAIDSKSTTSLLVELEPLLGDLPSSLIKAGGYQNVDTLLADLLPRLRARCSDAATSAGLAKTPALGVPQQPIP